MNKKFTAFLLGFTLLVLITATIFAFVIDYTHPVSWLLLALLIATPFLHRKFEAKKFVEWSDEYSVGIQSIDEQHKRLLSLINQLQTAVDHQTDATFVDEALGELVDYTRTHFSYEEKLLEDNDYPQFAEHKKEHEAMVEQVMDFLERYKKNKDETIEDITLFLKNWLINHINGTDKEYSSFLVGKGVK